MRICHRLNEKRGTVVSVSKDRMEITILLQKGGRVKARNEGFKIGDKVCFLLDAVNSRIIRVMSALTADVAATVGSDPILQAALEKEPDDNAETNFDDHEFADEAIIWEDEDGRNGETCGDPDEEQNAIKSNLDDSG